MKISLVGRGPGWERALSDFDEGADVWCVSTAFKELVSVGVQPSLVFQLHEKDCFEPWLYEEQNRVILMREDPEFECARILPIKRLIGIFGARFGSSFAWMFALSLVQGYTEITIRGIHLAHETEYGSQRDTFHWFVGVAMGKGVKINIDQDSGVFIENQAYGVKDGEA